MEPSSVKAWTIFMQPSKSVSKERTTAPLAKGWRSWATETLWRGSRTKAGKPAAAQ
jgi:hypothetical protein